MKVLDMPAELVMKAKQKLYVQTAVRAIIHELTQEIAKNHIELTEMWKDVQVEAEKQGVFKKEEEVFSFDYLTEKFVIRDK